MNPADIIQAFIDKYGYTSYLEIGVQYGITFDRIACERKISVDVAHNPTHLMTSNEYFNKHKDTFDIIFIDGSHTYLQSSLDIINAFNVLTPDGTIVVHDVLPATEQMQAFDACGQVWRSWLRLRQMETMFMYLIKIECGCGIINHGTQTPLQLPRPVSHITYDEYMANLDAWANTITPEEFNQLMEQ